jgi:RNA polymerase sigma-70 factor (ECF subfamily)
MPSGRPDPGAAATRVASLFEAHGRMVYGLCRLLLRDATDAEDAAQQTFVSAYGALLRGSVVGDPSAWLAAAARNECPARLRRREREPVSMHQAAVELLRSSAPDATHVLEGTAVREALAELPLRQREAVVLRDVLGFRTREVGAMLGLSRPAVEALVFRARRRLRVRLRAAATVLAVPVALREGLAQALPGAVAPAGAAVSGGVLAKLSAPLVAKVAVGLAAAGVAGSSAVEVEHELGRPPPPSRGPVSASPTADAPSRSRPVARSREAATLAVEPAAAQRSASRSRGRSGDDRLRSARDSGPGRGDRSVSSSGPGSGPELDDSGSDSGPGPGRAPDDQAAVSQDGERLEVELETSGSSSGPGSGDPAVVDDDGSGSGSGGGSSGPGG